MFNTMVVFRFVRSTQTSEPSGDYDATYWLGIYSVVSAGEIDFNDGRYYSSGTTYVCSPNDVTLTNVAYTYLPLQTDAIDYGGIPKNVTVVGSGLTFATIAGKTGAYFPNNLGLYLTIPFAPVTRLTVSFWAYAIDALADYTAFAISNSGLSTPSLQFTAGKEFTLTVKSAMPSAWTTQLQGSFVGPGRWFHLASTIDFSTYVLQLYLDGALVSTGTGSAPTTLAQNIMVLGRAGNATSAFNGYLRHFAVYHNLLSASDINALMQETACDPGLVANADRLCVHVASCPEPNFGPAYITSAGTLTYLSTRAVTCAVGYQGASSSVFCQANSTWSAPVLCQPGTKSDDYFTLNL